MKIKTSRIVHYRWAGCLALCVLVIVGLATKWYSGWAEVWVRDFSGDILYEMAWILLIGIWRPRWPSRTIAVGVFVITGLIELTQLIPFPSSLTRTLIWRLLLGTTFSFWDYPHYLLGCILG
ncbi:MAG: DUF2809 domain-containing protein, partial [Cyanobacteria bacterium P01_C01_bin.73]